jgi:hypothetical protein
MPRTRTVFMLVGILAAAGCSRTNSPAETQARSAADLERPPHAGAANAACIDLPTAADLKKWLRAARSPSR